MKNSVQMHYVQLVSCTSDSPGHFEIMPQKFSSMFLMDLDGVVK